MSIDLDAVLYICGAITGIAAAVAIITKFLRKSVANVSKEVSESVINEHEEDTLKAISDIANKLDDFIKNSNENDVLHKKTAIATARARINESYGYYMKKGCIDPYSLSVLEDVYEAYSAMGGNHLAERQIAELKKLKVDNGYSYKKLQGESK